MKFGLHLVGLGPHACAEVAAVAESAGFESVWLPEHLVFPAEMPPTYPFAEGGIAPFGPDLPLYDPWPVLAYIAHATSSIRLGTCVYVLPLRHPIAVARSVMTIDRLSRGRVTLGVGAGWLAEEYAAVDLPFADRGRRMDEMVPIVRRLWADEIVETHGERFDFGPVTFMPKPLGRIPIEIGGGAKRALERAGRLGDGWIEAGSASLTEAREKLAVVLRARSAAERDGEPFEVSFSGAHAADLDGARRCRDTGATRVIVVPDPSAFGLGRTAVTDWVRRYADDVVSRFDRSDT